MSSIYTVKPGETIVDVCENSTGSLVNLDAILAANDFDSWTPDLLAGQQIIIPDGIQNDANALRQLITYPICNNSVSNIDDQINAIFGELAGNWILKDGFWNDNGIWIDTAQWQDS